jgi:ribosomal protein S14
MLLITTINWIKKDKNSRQIFSKFEIKKIIIKSLLYNNKGNFNNKLYYDNLFKKFPFSSSISKYRTNCIFLGNSRSVFRRFKLSRHICKKLASNGFLIGFRKSSF